MKDGVAVYMSTFNEGPYLEASLKWLSKRVDAIYVFESVSAWAKDNGGSSESRTEKIIRELSGKDSNVKRAVRFVVLEGMQHSEPLVKETHERNQALARMQNDGYKWAWWIDADEFYTDFDAECLWGWFEDKLKKNPSIRGVRCSWHTYWRSMHWRVDPPEPYKPTVILRTDTQIVSSRHTTHEHEIITVPSEVCMARHYSWAKPPAEIEKKLTTWGHAKEGDMLGWKRRVFDNWKPGDELTNFHPSEPQCYGKVVECNAPIPEALQGHPYVGVQVIEGEPEDYAGKRKRIKAVILSHNMPENTDLLARTLADEFDVEVIDSGSDPDKVPESVTVALDNVYWTGGWNYALKKWSDYDAVWMLGCDIQLKDEPAAYRKAIEDAMPFGCWSPCVDGRAKPFMQKDNYDGIPRRVVNIEGMAMALSGELMRSIERLPSGSDGYGQDLWLCHMAWENDLKNVIDGSVSVFHPEGTGYDDEKFVKQMEDTFGKMYGPEWRGVFRFSDYFEDNLVKDDVEDVVEIEEVKPRMIVGMPKPVRPYHPAVIDVVSEESPVKSITVVGVDNGWGVDEFSSVLARLPEAKGLIVRKGVSEFNPEGIEVIEADRFDEALDRADVFLFPKVGWCNRSEFEKAVASEVPVVVRNGHQKDLEHERDVLAYEIIDWAVSWVTAAAEDDELRERLAQVDSAEKLRVTVITPTWGRDPAVLMRCLDCISLQTEGSWEHLVCSNGGREEAVERMIAERGDHRVRYFHTDDVADNDYGNTARRDMISKAKGEMIAFVDDDNVVLPEFLETMCDAVEGAEKDFAVCDVVHFGPLAQETGMKPPVVLKGEPVKLRYIDPLQVVVRADVMRSVGWDIETGYLSDGVTLEKLGSSYTYVKLHKVLGFHM